MPLGSKVSLDSSDIVLDGDGTQLPLPKGDRGPDFPAHVYCTQTAGWIKMPLDTNVGLGPGRIVLGRIVLHTWGPSSPAKRKGKERKSIYIAPFRTKVLTKRSGMDHTVLPANNTMPAFPSWRSPHVATTATEAADIQLHLSIRQHR